MSKFDALLENWKAPTRRNKAGQVYQVPYMLYGTTVDERKNDGTYDHESPHLAQFELIGSNKAAGRVSQYLKRGFKLLKYYVPESDLELQELKGELDRVSGKHDEEIQLLRSENERLKVLNSRVEGKSK